MFYTVGHEDNVHNFNGCMYLHTIEGVRLLEYNFTYFTSHKLNLILGLQNTV